MPLEKIERTIENNISRAKNDLRVALPFVGYVLYQTPVHILPGGEKEIAYTDGLNIYINGALIDANLPED
ncbi:MAG: hypothetical protein IKO42_00815, partial [Opitutales bacterium]|nr:hypothetical protein [Opitutales bacterium]